MKKNTTERELRAKSRKSRRCLYPFCRRDISGLHGNAVFCNDRNCARLYARYIIKRDGRLKRLRLRKKVREYLEQQPEFLHDIASVLASLERASTLQEIKFSWSYIMDSMRPLRGYVFPNSYRKRVRVLFEDRHPKFKKFIK